MWRNPIRKAGKLSKQLLVAGSQSSVDVIHSETGKMLHIFETKKDKKSGMLECLLCKEGRIFLMSHDLEKEERETAIIYIQLESC